MLKLVRMVQKLKKDKNRDDSLLFSWALLFSVSFTKKHKKHASNIESLKASEISLSFLYEFSFIIERKLKVQGYKYNVTEVTATIQRMGLRRTNIVPIFLLPTRLRNNICIASIAYDMELCLSRQRLNCYVLPTMSSRFAEKNRNPYLQLHFSPTFCYCNSEQSQHS